MANNTRNNKRTAPAPIPSHPAVFQKYLDAQKGVLGNLTKKLEMLGKSATEKHAQGCCVECKEAPYEYVEINTNTDCRFCSSCLIVMCKERRAPWKSCPAPGLGEGDSNYVFSCRCGLIKHRLVDFKHVPQDALSHIAIFNNASEKLRDLNRICDAVNNSTAKVTETFMEYYDKLAESEKWFKQGPQEKRRRQDGPAEVAVATIQDSPNQANSTSSLSGSPQDQPPMDVEGVEFEFLPEPKIFEPPTPINGAATPMIDNFYGDTVMSEGQL